MTSIIRDVATERGVDLMRKPWYVINRVVILVLAAIFPILPVNVVALGLLQRNVNELYEAEAKAEEKATAEASAQVNAEEETVVCDDAAPVEEPVVVEQIAEEKA